MIKRSWLKWSRRALHLVIFGLLVVVFAGSAAALAGKSLNLSREVSPGASISLAQGQALTTALSAKSTTPPPVTLREAAQRAQVKPKPKTTPSSTPLLISDAHLSGQFIPILLYHQPPSDFAAQMQTVADRGYTTVSLDQISEALAGRTPLPAKPVVITFDDGFSSQLSAVPILQQHQFKATFYIINGGEASNWCIGADRRPGVCGDSYMNWNEIRALDANPLFTIGYHSNDHLALAAQSPAVQRFQIIDSKATLEQHLGHAVRHFCYPYGSFNDTSVALVREAGYLTATTTIGGMQQPAGSRYTLRRIREASVLPQ